MGPIMQEKMTSLQSLMMGGWCARRKEQPVAVTKKQDEGPATVKTSSPVNEKQSLSSEARTVVPVTLKLKPASDLVDNTDKINTDKTKIEKITTAGPAVSKLSSKQRLSPAAKIFVPSKAAPDSDGSTTAGSADLLEDNRLSDSGSDLEIDGVKGTLAAATALMAKSSPTFPPPPGLAPPPGLDHPGLDTPPGLGHPLASKAPSTQMEKHQGTRLNSQATPFVPVFGKKAAPPNAKKISISSELAKAEASPTNNPAQFVGVTEHLQQSLAQLKGALAEWEACIPEKDAPASKAAAQVSPDIQSVTQTAELVGKISSLMEASTVASSVIEAPKPAKEMLVCNQQQWSPQVAEPSPVMSPWLPAWHAQAAGLEQQQSWQRDPRYNAWYAQKQSRQQATVAAAAARMTSDELPADTLRTNLRELETMPAERVLIVRRINRLGLESPTILENHFAKYGVVEKVLVSHSRAKSYYGGKPARVRPAGLGFILMSSAEETTAILKFGMEQVINGAVITVQPYETRTHEAGEVEEQALEAQPATEEDMHFQ